MLTFLHKTAQNIASLVTKDSSNSIQKDTLEEVLIECDIDYEIIEQILSHLPSKITREELKREFEVILEIKNAKKSEEENGGNEGNNDDFATRLKKSSPKNPLVSLIIGVNGAGKTTTIAKLAAHSLAQGKSTLLGAGDTFRAAASEQLKLWGERLGVSVVATKEGSDPSALAFSTIQSGLAKGIEHIIIDTAGRLPNQANLKAELEKILRVSKKALENDGVKKGQCQCAIILDGTQGSSALNQAKIFSESIKLDFAILTKLDGSAKGGVIFSIAHILGLPVEFIGVGEKKDDLLAFDKNAYIDGLLDCIFPA